MKSVNTMRAVLLSLATLGLVGCLGQLDSPGAGSVGTGTNPNPTGNDSQARKLFEDTVYPIIQDPGAVSELLVVPRIASAGRQRDWIVAGNVEHAIRDHHELPGRAART